MGLFGFGKRKKAKFKITDVDRDWVLSNFEWLVTQFGFPRATDTEILVNPEFFPNTFKDKDATVDNMILDLCKILELNPKKIHYEFQEDLRDTYGMPYEIEGKAFESQLISGEGIYKIFVAKSLLRHPERLILNLIKGFVEICLIEDKLQYDTEEDTDLFIYFGLCLLRVWDCPL